MARKFVSKILKFANHLAADYYSREDSRTPLEKSGKKKLKGEAHKSA